MNSRTRPHLSLRWLILAQLLLIPCSPLARAQTAAAAPASTTAESDDKKDITVLSPFEVVADTHGYYSGNTVSGTRFNTKLSDLASSITVMSKEQMADFGMLDVNDIFLYVAGTEGTGTYTDYTLDRNGSLSDNSSLNPTQANRIRGIAPANISLSNIETMGRVPVDPSTIDAIEVSRGPNANVSGLGNPSGTVNQVAASANMTRNRVTTDLRMDSFDGYRSSLDVNRVLLKGKLAVRASAVFQHEGFERKPSGVDTERYNGMIKFQPFKYTTVTGSVNYYHAYGNRPNSLPPRDNISYWQSQGSPTWDPVTQQIHNADGSNRGSRITAATYNGPDVFNATYLGNDHNQMYIDQNGLTYWAAPRSVASTTSPVPPSSGALAARYLQTSAILFPGGVFSGTAPRSFSQYLFNTTPTISSKSIYDWSSINLSAPNLFRDRVLTSNITIDQMLINTADQTLAVQATFMREDSERWARNLVGIANDNGQSGQLMVDINERLLDGTPNPFFLRPYLSVDKPRTASQPALWDTSRAQASYRLDLSRNENKFLKMLGWFQLTGYGEYKNRINRQYSYRDAIATPTVSWIPTATTNYRGFQAAPGITGAPALYNVVNLTQGLYKYYVGDKVGNNVDYAPGSFNYGTYNFNWGSAPIVNSSGVVTSPANFHSDSLLLDQVAADKSGGSLNTKVTIKTVGGVLQNHLFGDRLVTTFGARYDQTFTNFGYAGPTQYPNALLNTDGLTFNPNLIDSWAPTIFRNGGRTTNVQFVLRPFMDTPFVTNLEKNGGAGRFFGSLLNGFSLNSNKSNSFLVTAPAQDLFQHILPNPTGKEKSWGFGLNMFDGKLVVRATRFDNYQKDSQNGDASTMAQRVIRTDLPLVNTTLANPPITLLNNVQRWAAAPVVPVSGSGFSGGLGLTGQALTDYVAATTKISVADQAALSNPVPPFGTTNDVRSVGTELEVNLNPTRFWTVSASATDTKATNLNVSSTLANWIALRMPVWTTVVDPTISSAAQMAFDTRAGVNSNPNHLWWLHHYSATGQSPAENFQAFVGAPFGIIKALEGKSNPQVRRYTFRAATSFQLAAVTENKWLKRVTVGGAYRWEDKGAIGYYGVQSLPDIITELDPNRPIYDKSHYYVDLFVSYRTKFWKDKIGATFKVNVRNLGENGRLQPIGAFPDGTIHTYRIIDPQQFIFTASFDL